MDLLNGDAGGSGKAVAPLAPGAVIKIHGCGLGRPVFSLIRI
jgi:hypothetical protein